MKANLQDTIADYKKSAGKFSLITEKIWGTPSNIYNETRKNFVIAYLKAIQGSRPSDYDMKFYLDLIPKASTLSWKADAMFAALLRTVENSEKAMIEAFEQGGVDGVAALNAEWAEKSDTEVTLPVGWIDQNPDSPTFGKDIGGTKGFVSKRVQALIEETWDTEDITFTPGA